VPAFALVALSLAHIFDDTSFLALMSRYGLAAEANPLVVMLAQETGLPGLTLAKIVSVAFATILVSVIASWRRSVAVAVLVFGVAAGLIGGLSNIVALQ
jgi:hypothetical protein